MIIPANASLRFYHGKSRLHQASSFTMVKLAVPQGIRGCTMVKAPVYLSWTKRMIVTE